MWARWALTEVHGMVLVDHNVYFVVLRNIRP